jgi:predicted membrane protein
MSDENNFDPKKFKDDLRDQIHRGIRDRFQCDDEKQQSRRRPMVVGIALRGRGRGGIITGAFLMLIGLAFFFDQLGIFPVRQAAQFWPALLILVGAFNLRPGKSVTFGVTLIVAGTILLANQLGYTHIGFRHIWPAALIVAGFWMIFNSSKLKFGLHKLSDVTEAEADDTSSRVHVETVFGSNKRRIMSKTFQGGNAAAVFGEVRLDLSQAEIADDQAVLHADAVFGRVEIRVPEAWEVISRGAGAFGNFEDVTRSYEAGSAAANARKKLIVKGNAVFGEVQIRN